MVRALVSVCPESVNDIDYGSRTPLHYAARKSRVAVATHLLESGAAADYRYKFTTETCGYLLFKRGGRKDLLQIGMVAGKTSKRMGCWVAILIFTFSCQASFYVSEPLPLK